MGLVEPGPKRRNELRCQRWVDGATAGVVSG